jgi:hypothetical protein
MLPILRILPVGGVILAIVILFMALSPRHAPQPRLGAPAAGVRGPLADRVDHPEWRQFMMLAALRRAEELARLRDLPDAPVKVEPPSEAAPPLAAVAALPPEAAPPAPAIEAAAQPEAAPPAEAERAPEPKVAALPTTEEETKPDAALAAAPVPDEAATMLVEIGEASSTELPVQPREAVAAVNAAPPLLPSPPAVEAVRQVKAAIEPVRQLQPAIEPARHTKPAAHKPVRHVKPVRRVKPHSIRHRHVARPRAPRPAGKRDPNNFNLFEQLFTPPKPGAAKTFSAQ